MSEPTMAFEELRGSTREYARHNDKDFPRSAASYCAQFGIPLEDVQDKLSDCTSHDEMVRWCRSWAQDSDFRRASLALKVRPLNG